MEITKLKDKIAKLEAMAKMVGPEADNAKRAIERIIKKYSVTPDQLSKPKKKYVIKVHRLKKYALHLSKFMRLETYVIKGKADYISISVDEDEYVMFYELLDEIKHIFNKKEREYKAKAKDKLISHFTPPPNKDKSFIMENAGDICEQNKGFLLRMKNDMLKSFMKGYMDTNYPYDPTICIYCWEGKFVPLSNGKFKCNKCGCIAGVSKYQGFGKHQDAFTEGINTTTKSIKRTTERIGYHGM